MVIGGYYERNIFFEGEGPAEGYLRWVGNTKVKLDREQIDKDVFAKHYELIKNPVPCTVHGIRIGPDLGVVINDNHFIPIEDATEGS